MVVIFSFPPLSVSISIKAAAIQMTNQRQLFALLAVLGAHSGVTLKFHYHHLTAERISVCGHKTHRESRREAALLLLRGCCEMSHRPPQLITLHGGGFARFARKDSRRTSSLILLLLYGPFLPEEEAPRTQHPVTASHGAWSQ